MQHFFIVFTFAIFIIWSIGWVIFLTDDGWFTYDNQLNKSNALKKHRRKIWWHQLGMLCSFLLLFASLLLNVNPYMSALLFCLLFGHMSYTITSINEFPKPANNHPKAN